MNINMNIENIPFLIWLTFKCIVEHNILYGHIKVPEWDIHFFFFKLWPILYKGIVIVGNVTNHSPPFTFIIAHPANYQQRATIFNTFFTFSLVMFTNWIITLKVADSPL